MLGPKQFDRTGVQRRTIRVLSAAQVMGGIGSATIAAVGALLAAELASESLSGLSSTSSVIGAALFAIPVYRVMDMRGRRPGLLLAYAIGITGAFLVVIGAILDFFPLALVGLVATGGGMTAGMQSRYVAADLATPAHRGRALSTVVWATTIGSVLGPNLAAPMGSLAEGIGIPALAGPYLLTMAAFALAALTVAIFLRPDPLLTARAIHATATNQDASVRPQRKSIREVVAIIRDIPNARLGLMTMAVGQSVMVGVMSMTPIHLSHGGADLQVIGLVISGHVAGMYVAAPVFGIASDRVGRRPVILLGGVLLLLAFAVSGTASGEESAQLALGLFLLGLGWSCSLIAGSTLLTESISLENRASVQGTADLITGLCGASAGLLAGVVIALGSYALLNGLATLLVFSMIILALRSHYLPVPATRYESSG